MVTHFNTGLAFYKISTKQLSQFWQTKRERHKIISQLLHSYVLYFKTLIFDKMPKNIVRYLPNSSLQFTDDKTQRKDALSGTEDLLYIGHSENNASYLFPWKLQEIQRAR